MSLKPTQAVHRNNMSFAIQWPEWDPEVEIFMLDSWYFFHVEIEAPLVLLPCLFLLPFLYLLIFITWIWFSSIPNPSDCQLYLLISPSSPQSSHNDSLQGWGFLFQRQNEMV